MEYLNGWTKEKIIEKINNEFKGFSGNDTGGCYYKHPNNDGRKCIVGLFLTDELLESMDGEGYIYHVSIKHPEILELLPFNIIAMSNWQRIHDRVIQECPLEKQKQLLINLLK